MLYRPYEGYGATESELAQTLHNIAVSINAAKQAGNRDAVQGLWTQFQAVALEYKSTGATSAAINDLINRVHDTVIGTVQEAAGVAGGAAAQALGLKSLWPLALVAIGFFFLPQILTAARPRRRAA